ncbi:ATP-binding protein [Streptomyces canus]|uniref:ATP-binding protein n=1 Tax=Streptomyces canus TaxID=58343 RepID=UPI0036F13381
MIFLGPPGTGKTHLATGLGIRPCQAGHRVAFGTAAQWVTSLAEAHQARRLSDELTRLGRIPLIVVDEAGYIPFEPEAANLFFQFVSGRYERASVIPERPPRPLPARRGGGARASSTSCRRVRGKGYGHALLRVTPRGDVR